MKTLFAHGNGPDESKWQPLAEHSSRVAALADHKVTIDRAAIPAGVEVIEM